MLPVFVSSRGVQLLSWHAMGGAVGLEALFGASFNIGLHGGRSLGGCRFELTWGVTVSVKPPSPAGSAHLGRCS